jgi:PhnB protein
MMLFTVPAPARVQPLTHAMAAKHTYDPDQGFARIMPALRYEDVGEALTWLADVFGATEHLRWTDPSDGTVRHSEIRFGNAFVEVTSISDGYATPNQTGKVAASLVVMVDDADAHHAHAQAAGATVVEPPSDRPWGLRQYKARDLAGHEWEFAHVLRDVPPPEWGATLTDREDW